MTFEFWNWLMFQSITDLMLKGLQRNPWDDSVKQPAQKSLLQHSKEKESNTSRSNGTPTPSYHLQFSFENPETLATSWSSNTENALHSEESAGEEGSSSSLFQNSPEVTRVSSNSCCSAKSFHILQWFTPFPQLPKFVPPWNLNLSFRSMSCIPLCKTELSLQPSVIALY